MHKSNEAAELARKIWDTLEEYGKAGMDEDPHFAELLADVEKIVKEVI